MRNAETVVGVHRERHGAHVLVTGEPVARKAGTAGSGRGPLEKDLERTRHLASGLPVRSQDCRTTRSPRLGIGVRKPMAVNRPDRPPRTSASHSSRAPPPGT
jgi:hypothetical protein